jgi:hypothetical protein
VVVGLVVVVLAGVLVVVAGLLVVVEAAGTVVCVVTGVVVAVEGAVVVVLTGAVVPSMAWRSATVVDPGGLGRLVLAGTKPTVINWRFWSLRPFGWDA